MLYYAGQQLVVLANPQLNETSSADFTLLFAVVGSATFALWAGHWSRIAEIG
jgi:hypothetical protein